MTAARLLLPRGEVFKLAAERQRKRRCMGEALHRRARAAELRFDVLIPARSSGSGPATIADRSGKGGCEATSRHWGGDHQNSRLSHSAALRLRRAGNRSRTSSCSGN